MQLQRHSNQSILTFDSTQQIGSGGEGAIYAVGKDKRLAAKVYHKPTHEQEHKLLAMFRNPPEDPMRSQGHASIAWPTDLLRTTGEKSRIVGFLMPRVEDMFSVIDLFVPKSRLTKCPLFTYQYLHRAARNIAAAIAPLHARGYVIGDINESNILVSTSALISLVDTDSFQVKEAGGKIYRCGVGKAEFTPPELQGRSLRDVDRVPAHDLFGLSVLIFQLLMEGTHPFAAQYKGEGDPPSIVNRIQHGEFPYANSPGQYAPPPIAPDFGILDPELRELLLRCYEEGHSNPNRRPTATAWQEALDRAESRLKRCRKNSQHRYGAHMKSCPWCARAELLGGRDYFPSQRSVDSGIHLAPTAPKQTPLPALQTAASAAPVTGKSAVRRVGRAKRKNPGRFAASFRPKWHDWVCAHPAAHVALCALAGGLALGGVRLALGVVAHPAHTWLSSAPNLRLNGAGGGIGLAAASIAIGAGAVGLAWFAGRPRTP